MNRSLLFLCVLPAASLAATPPPPLCHSSTEATCRDSRARGVSGSRGATDTLGRGAWLIDEENDEVLLAAAEGVTRRISVGAWPEQLVVDSGGRVFVTCRQAGRVDVIDTSFALTSIPIGPEPRALALDEAGHRLFVGTATGRELVSFDTRTLAPMASQRTPLPVVALAVTALGLAVVSDRDSTLSFYPEALDGSAPLVTSLSSSDPAGPLGLVGIRGIRGSWGTGGFDRLDSFGESDSAAVRPLWLVPNGDGLIVVSRATFTGQSLPSSGGGYGGSVGQPHQLLVQELEHLSKGLSAGPGVQRLTLHDAAAVTLTGNQLHVASRTNALVTRIDLAARATDRITAIGPLRLNRVSRQRAQLSRHGVESMQSYGVSATAALEDGRLLLVVPARRELALLGPATGLPMLLQTFTAGALPTSKLDAELALGRALFHDAANPRLSQRGMSCSNCHVDGREDGLVWEQNATLRQTPMLAGGRLAETAPYNWQGSAHSLEENITQTVQQRLSGAGLTELELAALSRYVREGLRPVARPAARDLQLVERGREVFSSAQTGCVSCHPADFAFTDGEAHDVKSVSTEERASFEQTHGVPSQLEGFSKRMSRAMQIPVLPRVPRVPTRFDTPALAFLSLTAPYLHDGSARTLGDLVEHNSDKMGTTSQLTPREKEALVAYLESL